MKKIQKITAFIMLMFLTMLFSINAKAENKSVIDGADLFSDNQIRQLEAEIKRASNKAQLDFVILTTDSLEGMDAELYAMDFYDNNGYGYGNSQDGVLLLLSMEGGPGNRDVVLIGSGNAKEILDDSSLNYVRDYIIDDLIDEDYYNAALNFVELSKNIYLEPEDYEDDIIEVNGDDYYYEENSIFTSLKNPLICFIIALIVAVIAVLIMRGKSKTPVTATSKTYMNNGLNVKYRQDQYTHITTTRRKVETNNNSSSRGGRSGGGSHVSSSGRSHSASRGKF